MSAPTTRELYTAFNRQRKYLRKLRENKGSIVEQTRIWENMTHLFTQLPTGVQAAIYGERQIRVVRPRVNSRAQTIVGLARQKHEESRMRGRKVGLVVSDAVEKSVLARLTPSERGNILLS
ncbi:MAG: hypothetical protein RLZZ283_409 [Candidatus Parcubacteria bacterium]|jgi:hypothetical protein